MTKFWVIIPFTKIDSRRQITLDIRTELYNGNKCASSMGSLTLEPEMSTAASSRRTIIDDKSFGEPIIAICMTTYNPSLRYFKKQIDSLICQTYTKWVCIINDDCSEPEIFEKVKDIVAGDRRFILYRNPSNLGFYHNFERCLSYVPEGTSFVALADQDDYWHEDKLSTLMALFDKDTTLVYSDMNIVDTEGNVIYNTYWTTRKNNFSELDLLILTNTVTGAASLFRRELLNVLLPFPAKIGDFYHDHFIACVALAMGKIKYHDKPLYDYYQHSGNVLGHYVKQNKVTKEELIELLKNLKERLTIRRWFNDILALLKHNQAEYYNHYPRRVMIAHVLRLRCSNVSGEKRRIIERFVSFEKSVLKIFLQIVKDKLLNKDCTTLGMDSLLLKSIFANRLINAYYRCIKKS